MQTTSTISTKRVVDSLPPPEVIRARLAELRTEARILRELLPITERRAKMTAKQQEVTTNER